MSSKKYLLNKDGSINVSDSSKSASEVTKDFLSKQQDSFSKRAFDDRGFVKTPPVLDLPASPLFALSSQIIDSESPVYKRDSEGNKTGDFPQDKDYFLINTSFGADEPIKYYYNYNNAFAETFDNSSFNKNIYAEELEIIAGFELNSLGLILSSKGIDASYYFFTLQYIVESIVYILSYVATLKLDKTSVLSNYLVNLLPQSKTAEQILKSSSKTGLDSFFVYYVLGLNEFINSDPKNKSYLTTSDDIINLFSTPTGGTRFRASLLLFFKDTFFNLSKVGRNRFFLTVRKFQQESYWNTELLYKHKKSNAFGIGITAENILDKFAIQFSQYFFLFILQRVHIGYTIHKSKASINDTIVKGYDSRQIDISRFRKANSNYQSMSLEQVKKLKAINKVESELDDYEWAGDKTVFELQDSKGNNQPSSIHSLLSLPQLLKTTDYLKTQIDPDVIRQNFSGTTQKRLSQDVVKKVEKALESEYVPFYFHDIRTNEIISFHAFLDSISDSFSPEYTSTHGFGRIDDVKHYVKTTRSISLAFNIISYNPQDSDFMWYQINKLVSMVYPQWSKGLSSNATGANLEPLMPKDFTFPFTQMPTASPMIRLRVGDVIKSNYSEKNISRLHGHKLFLKRSQQKDNPEGTTALTTKKVLWNRKRLKKKHANVPVFFLPNEVIVHYYDTAHEFMTHPLITRSYSYLTINKDELFRNYINFTQVPPERLPVIYSASKFELAGDNKKFADFVRKNIRQAAVRAGGTMSSDTEDLILSQYSRFLRTHYVLTLGDSFYIINKYFFEVKNDAQTQSVGGQNINVLQNFDKDPIVKDTIGGKINNAITKAFETSKGKGLAGFITNLSVDYQNSTWSTSEEENKNNSIAPYSVKININFAPVHDIPPGLDYEGNMRAPIYNVGKLNNLMFGDVYDPETYNQD